MACGIPQEDVTRVVCKAIKDALHTTREITPDTLFFADLFISAQARRRLFKPVKKALEDELIQGNPDCKLNKIAREDFEDATTVGDVIDAVMEDLD